VNWEDIRCQWVDHESLEECGAPVTTVNILRTVDQFTVVHFHCRWHGGSPFYERAVPFSDYIVQLAEKALEGDV
jgi:hypothetical protein